jgi:hypothetical protein
VTQALLFHDDAVPQPPRFADLVTEGNAESWAVFSHGEAHRASGAPYWRYLLCRVWNPTRPLMGWLCCNPSDADHQDNDPSVRKMIGFARRRDAGGILLGNALAFATPYPSVLAKAADPLGPRNVELIQWLAANRSIDILVAGWGGALPKKLRELARVTIRAASEARELWCYGTCERQPTEPRHPLMLPYATPLVRFGVS